MSAPRDDERIDAYNPADLCPRFGDPAHNPSECDACNGLEPDWIHDEPAPSEQEDILATFVDLLRVPTGDGGNKRAAGVKPFWKVDPGHPAASGRHRAKHAAGERYDVESGAHHLVHSAWRDLATAYQEMVEDGLIPEDPR